MIWVLAAILVVLVYLAWLLPTGINTLVEQGRASTNLQLKIEQQLTAVQITLDIIEGHERIQAKPAYAAEDARRRDNEKPLLETPEPALRASERRPAGREA